MKTTARLLILSLVLFSAVVAHADTFGSGANQFDVAFVPIGNADNLDDSTGKPNLAGKVEYAYRMGTYEISEDMINRANALGGLGISHKNRGVNKPAQVSWLEAATFVNWLNANSGHAPAYKFSGDAFELWQPGDAGYNPANPFRNSQAFYFLPSADEWYKAAYYDPTGGVYYNWPTGSDDKPSQVASGTAANTAVYSSFFGGGFGTILPEPADITLAGGLSPYGTMGQGGNISEWEETEFDLVNDGSSSKRGARGGYWADDYWTSEQMDSSHRLSAEMTSDGDDVFVAVGFRVASVPEPSTVLLGALAAGGLLARKRR